MTQDTVAHPANALAHLGVLADDSIDAAQSEVWLNRQIKVITDLLGNYPKAGPPS